MVQLSFDNKKKHFIKIIKHLNLVLKIIFENSNTELFSNKNSFSPRKNYLSVTLGSKTALYLACSKTVKCTAS